MVNCIAVASNLRRFWRAFPTGMGPGGHSYADRNGGLPAGAAASAEQLPAPQPVLSGSGEQASQISWGCR